MAGGSAGSAAWDKCRVFFVVMVERENEHPDCFEAILKAPVVIIGHYLTWRSGGG
jgi:hypothetical protein